MDGGVLTGAAEGVDQLGPDVGRYRESEALDPRLSRLGPLILLVAGPPADELVPVGAEDRVEMVAFHREPGLFEDAGPGLQPAPREVAALLEDEGVPVVEGDSINGTDGHRRNLRPRVPERTHPDTDIGVRVGTGSIELSLAGRRRDPPNS